MIDPYLYYLIAALGMVSSAWHGYGTGYQL